MGHEPQAIHPCQSCGACCAYYRVAFHWMQAEPGGVPLALTQDLDLQQRVMKGTDRKHRPRCVALRGEVGQSVACTIYESRPTPCRRFTASYEKGVREPRCDEAREVHGLRPLTKADWPSRRDQPSIPVEL